MDEDAAGRVIALFETRGQLERIASTGSDAASTCLARADQRLSAATVLVDARLWESAFTTAYDAYRTAADAIVLSFGYRVPATAGGHRIATDVAFAALGDGADAFAPATAERFRQGRHQSEYFDPARPIDKTASDATWALGLGERAVEAVRAALSSL